MNTLSNRPFLYDVEDYWARENNVNATAYMDQQDQIVLSLKEENAKLKDVLIEVLKMKRGQEVDNRKLHAELCAERRTSNFIYEQAKKELADLEENCPVCKKQLKFPDANDPKYSGDTSITSECRHVIREHHGS